MRIIITEEQFNKFNRSSQAIQNGIIRYLNHLFSEAERTFSTRNNNYGNLSENWCIDGNTGFTVIYYFEDGKFVKGVIIVLKDVVDQIRNIFSIKQSYALHVIEEWYEDVIIPKFEKMVGETGLYINVIDTKERTYECIPEATKPEGITDEEMIDFIVKNTLHRKPEVIKTIESGRRDLEDFYLDIVDTVKGREIRGF